MPTTLDQVRPLVFSLPPQELRALVVEITSVISGSVSDAIGPQGPAAGTKWQRLAERLRNNPLRDDPRMDAAWKQFREDVREVHENFLAG